MYTNSSSLPRKSIDVGPLGQSLTPVGNYLPFIFKGLSGVILPLTSAEACKKSGRWIWKERLFKYWFEKARKHVRRRRP